jgi:hypothetical protein
VQVVVLLLLVAGLALLVLGLIAGSTAPVLASIAASLLAAYAMTRFRRRPGAGSDQARASKASGGGLSLAKAPVPAAAAANRATALTGPAAVAQPTAAESVPAAAAAQPARAASLAADEPADAHSRLVESPVPDDPDDPAGPEPAVADTDPPLRSRGDEPVWVIDGRPRYHLSGCGFLLGRHPEPVPLRQAVEDGFTPCALCDPDSELAAR